MSQSKLNLMLEDFKTKIRERHSEDSEQLSAIFSESKRILVEAPAGCGKTQTLISKIAYLFASKQIPNPKRLLALTFSVNAAYKIKKDVISELPQLLGDSKSTSSIKDRIHVSNYHGFCKSLLKKYGRVFHENLSEINKLNPIDDSNVARTMQTLRFISNDNANILAEFSNAVKNKNSVFVKENLSKYCEVIVQEVLPHNFVSYNAVICLTIKLLMEHQTIQRFYQTYFDTLFVDEFQDTNALSLWLVTLIVGERTKMLLLGDQVQQIYGFIGAIDRVLAWSERRFNLEKIVLKTNHRFSSNPEMLQLDSNIRSNAENPTNPNIVNNLDAKVNFILTENQSQEAKAILEKSQNLLQSDASASVAILVKQRGSNTDVIVELFRSTNTPFFYGLFTDDDSEYTKFHTNCLNEFLLLLKESEKINRSFKNKHLAKIEEIHADSTDSTIHSVMKLLKVFWNRVFSEYNFLSDEEKTNLIKETFSHNALKQSMEFIDERIIITTVHAAKGLEWDFVIIPDMEEDSFPSYLGMCGKCNCRSNCEITIDNSNETLFLKELSIFYVAVTRARKKVICSASKTSLDRNGNERPKKTSCFLKLPGIKLKIL